MEAGEVTSKTRSAVKQLCGVSVCGPREVISFVMHFSSRRMSPMAQVSDLPRCPLSGRYRGKAGPLSNSFNERALSAPPGEASHWTGRMLAKAAGVSLRSVQRILEAHQLAPHRIRTFKVSNDP